MHTGKRLDAGKDHTSLLVGAVGWIADSIVDAGCVGGDARTGS